MHQKAIQRIAEEVCNKAGDRFLGKILQLSPVSFALDVGLRGVFLFISAEPSSPRFYLIQRRMKELEKQSIPLSNFGQQLRHQLGTGRIVGCGKDRAERIVRLTLRVEDDFGRVHFRRLVAQLTGRAANLFILDELDRVVAALPFLRRTRTRLRPSRLRRRRCWPALRRASPVGLRRPPPLAERPSGMT